MALASPAIVNIFRSSAKVIDVSSKKNVLSSASSLSRHKSPNSVTHNKLFHSFSIENIPKFVYNDESKRFTSSAAKQKRYCFYIFLCNNCVIILSQPRLPQSLKHIILQFCSYKLLVVGGGAGGCSTAAKFASKLGKGQVAVLEPSEVISYRN